jgi:hypothetical protein
VAPDCCPDGVCPVVPREPACVDRALGGFGDSDLEASALEESGFVASALDPSALDPSALDPSALDPSALAPSALGPSAFGGSGCVCGGAGGGGVAAGCVWTGSGGVVAGWGCTDDGGVAAGWVCSTGAWASWGAGGWVDGFSCAVAISAAPNAADINSTQSCCRLTNPSSVRTQRACLHTGKSRTSLSPYSDRSGSYKASADCLSASPESCPKTVSDNLLHDFCCDCLHGTGQEIQAGARGPTLCFG